MTEYKFNLNIEGASTWDDLTKGKTKYSLYLGVPKNIKSDPIIPIPSDLVGLEEIKPPEIAPTNDVPWEVTWKSTTAPSTAKYSMSYSLTGDIGAGPNIVDMKFGEAVELKRETIDGVISTTFAKMERDATWAVDALGPPWADGALGFKNNVRALPVVLEQDATGEAKPLTSPTKALWVPGEGTLKPTPHDRIYAWFYNHSAGGEDDGIAVADFSYAKLLVFKNVAPGREPNKVTYNDSLGQQWGEFTGPQAAKVRPPQVTTSTS